MTGPRMAVAPNMAVPIGCWLRGRRVAMMVCAVGIMAPPVMPWPTRPAIIMASDVDSPHSTENAVNSAATASRNVRSPNTRSSQPDSGIMTISATR